jgi:catechol 2,3-dioxygenase-like lactoylglutathione lyase family enzyme
MHIGLVAIVVRDYDPAISFFVGTLGFELGRTPGGDERRASQAVGRGPAAWCGNRPAASEG